MKRVLLLTGLLFLTKSFAQTWKTEDQYIQNFAAYAVEEMEKYKIPASITLAQGLLETGGGQSRLAQQGNNHFGIKCKENWTGRTMKHTDDAPNECFRAYDDPRQSYEDHSLFLTTRKHYSNLFLLDPKDYKGWSHGLKKSGYATNPKYAYILINKIEKLKLYEFDRLSSKEVHLALLKMYPDLENDKIFMAKLDQNKKTAEKVKPRTYKVPYRQTSFASVKTKVENIKRKSNYEIAGSLLVKNHPNGGMKFVVVPEDLELKYISGRFGIDISRLQKWNDLETDMVKQNSILFLEPKNSEGNIATYKAEIGEDMHDIAQKFAVKLDKLYTKNRMDEGDQPKAGDIIYLQGKRPRN